MIETKLRPRPRQGEVKARTRPTLYDMINVELQTIGAPEIDLKDPLFVFLIGVLWGVKCQNISYPRPNAMPIMSNFSFKMHPIIISQQEILKHISVSTVNYKK